MTCVTEVDPFDALPKITEFFKLVVILCPNTTVFCASPLTVFLLPATMIPLALASILLALPNTEDVAPAIVLESPNTLERLPPTLLPLPTATDLSP